MVLPGLGSAVALKIQARFDAAVAAESVQVPEQRELVREQRYC